RSGGRAGRLRASGHRSPAIPAKCRVGRGIWVRVAGCARSPETGGGAEAESPRAARPAAYIRTARATTPVLARPDDDESEAAHRGPAGRVLVVASRPFSSPRSPPVSVYYRTLVPAESRAKRHMLTYGAGDDVDIP